MAEPLFFDTAAEFRAWLEEHHDSEREALLGFYKKGSGKGGPFTYEQAILEALCFGWIDGVRRTLDAESYSQRFSPRTKSSTWSNININRFKELLAAGRVHPAGLAAFEARTAANSGIYSFEQADVSLDEEQERTFRANTAAWEYWSDAPKGYRRIATWWVISAKRPETRAKRLGELIECSANGIRIPLVRRAGEAS
jgi:uncharacterized protein YdeI (YjbR/CyaY-like superfamily)